MLTDLFINLLVIVASAIGLMVFFCVLTGPSAIIYLLWQRLSRKEDMEEGARLEALIADAEALQAEVRELNELVNGSGRLRHVDKRINENARLRRT